MKRFEYNKAHLVALAKVYNVSVNEIPDKLNRHIDIYYKCCCYKNHNKLYEYIRKSGFRCDTPFCINRKKHNDHDQLIDLMIQSSKEIKSPIKYTREFLETHLQKHEAKLVDKIPDKLNRDSLIQYSCKCGKIGQNIFRRIVEDSGACCDICKAKNTIIKQEGTCLKNYGVPHPSKSKVITDKKTSELKKKYGENIINISQIPGVQNKKEATTLHNYGVKHPTKSEKIKKQILKTNIEKHGVAYPMQSKIIQDKSKATSMKNFGTPWPNQNQDQSNKVLNKMKKYKEYKFPSGNIRKVQGYEPFALTELSKKYTEEQIKTDRKDVPRIIYKVKGVSKYYFPDIFIPHENIIIEVKSTWTYGIEKSNVQQKAEYTRACGYNFEFWVFNSKGERVAI